MSLLPVESYNRLQPRATVWYKWLKKSRLDMVDMCYHVKACNFQIVSSNTLNTWFFSQFIRKRYWNMYFFYCSFVWCYENTIFLNDLPVNMYIGEYCRMLFGITLLKHKFVTGWVIQSFKTESHCFVQTSEDVSFRHGWCVLPYKSILHL